MAEGARRRLLEKTVRWPLPLRGVWNGIDDITVPLDALFDADNIVIRSGTVRGRPGIAVLDAGSFTFDSRVTGALNAFTTAGDPRLVAGSNERIYSFDYTSWTDRSGVDELGGSPDLPARITQFIFGTPAVTQSYVCNGVSVLRSWKDGDALNAIVPGVPPIFKDITVAADRLVGLNGAYGVQWGDPLTDATWPAVNQRLLSETPGHTTAIRNMGTLGLIIHKTDSLWVGQVTGATGAQAFCFTLRGYIDGAAGPNAIADVRGAHYYMTQYGRVGFFTGFSHKWIADGMWPIIREEIDQDFPRRIVAYYHPQQEEIWFHYPRKGDAGENLGLLILRLKQPDFNYPFDAGLPGIFGKAISAGVNVAKTGLDVPIVFTSTSAAEKSYTLDGVDDDGVTINSFFQTGLSNMADVEASRIIEVEPFFERNAGFGSLTLRVATSNILDKAEGNLSAGQTVDLTALPVYNSIGFDARGRFTALRAEFDSTATVRYRGAILASNVRI